MILEEFLSMATKSWNKCFKEVAIAWKFYINNFISFMVDWNFCKLSLGFFLLYYCYWCFIFKPNYLVSWQKYITKIFWWFTVKKQIYIFLLFTDENALKSSVEYFSFLFFLYFIHISLSWVHTVFLLRDPFSVFHF